MGFNPHFTKVLMSAIECIVTFRRSKISGYAKTPPTIKSITTATAAADAAAADASTTTRI